MSNLEARTIEKFASFSRKVAAQGMVLLKNQKNTLPVKENEVLSIFGRCQIDYYRSGTGSGGSVNVPYSISALEGFRKNTSLKINEELASVYENFVKENPFDDGGGGWAAEPWFQEEMLLDDQLVQHAAKSSDKALIIIGRTAGEEQDNKDAEGSYRLTQNEIDMITKVTKFFDQVIVVLNVSNIIDMSWMDNNDSITSVLYAWHGGMEGGNALADVISGYVTPSGKLTDTLAYKLEDYPSYKNFDEEVELFYQEDIYLGYRYFETFNKSAVRYPFGFGLSYTKFDTKCVKTSIKGEGKDSRLEVELVVENIGDEYSGKEVVQLYLEGPQGKLGRPSKALVGFSKTKELNPGEEETINMIIPVKEFGTYDDSGVTGHKSSYVLEAGEYKVYAGSDVRNSQDLIYTYEQEELEVTDSFEEVMAPRQGFTRFKPGALKSDGLYELTYEEVPQKTIDLEKRMKDGLPNLITMTGDQGLKLKDVKEGKCSLADFIGQLSQHDLETIVRGEGMSSPKVTSGTAGCFGGVGDNLLHFGIPVAACADGPSGVRRDTGEEAVQVPIGTLLACTWDVDLVNELYVYEGKELFNYKIDSLLGPGMNIHRHPLNGRNFEYFSEDPYLTGAMAVAIVKGLREGGSEGTIKHFAANDQEYNRQGVDSVVSERALREIHLKGFEMAVRDGGAKSIMTTYNPVNGIWNASNYDLNTTVLRHEWGFKGIVMTDWWARMNDPVHGGEPSVTHVSSMVRSQNDIFMPVNNFGAEVNSMNDDQSECIESGVLTIAELQRSAMNICRFILESPCLDRPLWKPEVKEFTGVSMTEEVELGIRDLPISSNCSYWIEIKDAGIHNIIYEMRYDKDPGAQSACNVLLNEEYMTTLNLNGTRGRIIKEKAMPILLEKGFYKVDLVYIKPGLEILSLSVDKQ